MNGLDTEFDCTAYVTEIKAKACRSWDVTIVCHLRSFIKDAAYCLGEGANAEWS